MPKPNRTAFDAVVTLGKRIRARRLELGLTQEQLAYAAGVTVGWLSDLERGQRKRPELPALLAVAAALQMDPGDLFRGLAPDPTP